MLFVLHSLLRSTLLIAGLYFVSLACFVLLFVGLVIFVIVLLLCLCSSLLYNAGISLINGLTRGITDRINGAINTIKSMANAVKNAFESVLGIHSPSKVFYGYGKNITQGLIDGMGARKATVRVATEEMASKVTSAGKMAGATNNDTKIYGNITIGNQSDSDAFFARMTKNQELASKNIATRAGALG